MNTLYLNIPCPTCDAQPGSLCKDGPKHVDDRVHMSRFILSEYLCMNREIFSPCEVLPEPEDYN